LLVALIVLGPDKLPAAARTFGKYMAEFRKFSASVQAQVDEALKEPPTKSDTTAETSEAEETEKPPNPDTSGFEMIDQTKPNKDPES
jgi:Sec-independent protein translocase protein TatA